MYELNEVQIDMISGGVMSTETKIIIGVSLAVCPLLGAGMLLGYYANTK